MTAARDSCSLSLRERAGVRGRASTNLDRGQRDPFRATGGSCLGQDPLTPTLSRREREQ